MESNKKLKIRKKNGCIQTIPLYTEKKDISSPHKLGLDIDGIKLYAELVDTDTDYSSALRCRKNRAYAVKKRDPNTDRDILYLTNQRRILMYEEEKYQEAVSAIESLMQDYAMAVDDAERQEIGGELDKARALAASMRFENTFYHQKLEEIPNKLDISAVDDTSYMYSGCKDLNVLQPLDLSKSKDAHQMFDRCMGLPAVFPYAVDFSSISDVSKLKNMFRDSSVRKVYCVKAPANVAEALPDAKRQIGAQVIMATLLTKDKYRMSDLFPKDYKGKTSFPDSFCCLGMESLAGIYKDCAAMTDVHKMDTPWIKDFREAFSGCSSLPKEFPFVIDITAVRDPEMLRNMFKDSSADVIEFAVYDPEFIKQITPELLGKAMDVRTSLNITNERHRMSEILPDRYQTMVKPYAHLKLADNFTDATEMYKGCRSLTEIEDENLSGAVGITKAKGMFQSCSSLVKAPYVDLSQCRDLSDLFYGCGSLTEIPAISTKKAKTLDSMLYGCKSLPKVLPWMIDARTVGYENAFRNMLLGTPVEEVMLVNVDKDVRSTIQLSKVGENLKTIDFYETVDWILADSLERYEEDFDKIVLWDEYQLCQLTHVDEINELRFDGLGIIDDCIGGSLTLRIIRKVSGTEKVKSMHGLFAGCHHLTTLPSIDINAISTVEGLRDMLQDTNVEEIHFANADEEVKKNLTPDILGKTKLQIVFD